MFKTNGYYIKARVLGELCKRFKVDPIGRAILEHLHEQADYSNALYESSARRIAEEINSKRKNVLWAQLKLKRSGLIHYNSNSGSGTTLYFLPFFTLEATENHFTVTRFWYEAVQVAADINLTKKRKKETLSEILFSAGSRWPDNSNLKMALTKNITEYTYPELVYGSKLTVIPTRREMTELARETGMKNINNIRAKIGGGKAAIH